MQYFQKQPFAARSVTGGGGRPLVTPCRRGITP